MNTKLGALVPFLPSCQSCALPLLAALVSVPLTAQRLLREESGSLGSRYAASVSPAGDVDADGKPDYLVAVPGRYAVQLVSGRTGGILRSFATSGSPFCVVAGGADIDHDGRFDVAIGEPLYSPNGRTDAGRVRVFDASGRLLFERVGARARDYYGHALAFWHGGLVVGAPQGRSAPLAVGPGYVELLGPTGGVMTTRNGSAVGNLCGFAVAVTSSTHAYDWRSLTSTTTIWIGVGRPGVASVDLMVYTASSRPGGLPQVTTFLRSTVTGPALGMLGFSLATTATVPGGGGDLLVGNLNTTHGEMRVLSGISLYERRRHTVTPYTEQYYATGVAGAGDVDGDGVTDYMIASGGDSTSWADDVVNLHSGRTGALLYRFQSRVGADGVGLSMAPLGDLDGDGLGDILIGLVNSAGAFPNNHENGALRIHAGSRFWFSVPNMVVAAQGPMRMTSNGPPGALVVIGAGPNAPTTTIGWGILDAQGALVSLHQVGAYRGTLRMQAMCYQNGALVGVSPIETVQVF